MKKFKEVLSKNNYLVAKIAGGVVAGVTAIIVIVAITTKDKEVAAEVRTTSHEEITTVEEEKTSTEQIVEEKTSLEELSSNIEVTSEEEITTNTVGDSGETSTKESTTKQTTTVKQTTTTKQTTTAKPTTTTAQTTTTKPTATTKQPETTKPLRGANGVILETLTIQYLVEAPYTIPDTWNEYYKDNGGGGFSGRAVSSNSVVNGRVLQNIFGNEIKVYNPNDGTGSELEDVIAIYGEPMYEYSFSEVDKTICYKYKVQDYGENQNIYISFYMNSTLSEGKLRSIMITNLQDEIEDGYIVP